MSKKHQPRRAKGAPAAKPQLPADARIDAPQQTAPALADATVLEAEPQVAAKHEASGQESAAAATAEEAATVHQAAETGAIEHDAPAPEASGHASKKQQANNRQATKQQATQQQATQQQATKQQATQQQATQQQATQQQATQQQATQQQATKQQATQQQATQQQAADPQAKAASRKDSHQASRHDTVQEPQSDIRGVLIQLAGARLLLPNATIAEVLSYAPPEPVEAAPEWLLGKIRWRGWQLPLVAFAELAGVGKEPAGLGSKVVVLKALGGNATAPYFAILSQGFPRLVTVAQQGLVEDSDSAGLPLGVHSRVIMNEDTAFVPDLGVVESLITDALAQAA